MDALIILDQGRDGDMYRSTPQVVAERVALRSGPSLGAPVLGQVPRGVLAQSGAVD